MPLVQLTEHVNYITQDTLQELYKDKTSITIDHNILTVKENRFIIVIEKARVSAYKTELLEHSEAYKKSLRGNEELN